MCLCVSTLPLTRGTCVCFFVLCVSFVIDISDSLLVMKKKKMMMKKMMMTTMNNNNNNNNNNQKKKKKKGAFVDVAKKGKTKTKTNIDTLFTCSSCLLDLLVLRSACSCSVGWFVASPMFTLQQGP